MINTSFFYPCSIICLQNAKVSKKCSASINNDFSLWTYYYINQLERDSMQCIVFDWMGPNEYVMKHRLASETKIDTLYNMLDTQDTLLLCQLWVIHCIKWVPDCVNTLFQLLCDQRRHKLNFLFTSPYVKMFT